MNNYDDLLQLAVENNVAWCSAVCAAHRSNETVSAAAWVNLNPSPPFYPNIITRAPNSQATVLTLIERFRAQRLPKGWGIKDSFYELALVDWGFESVLKGSWFGGVPMGPPTSSDGDWKKVVSLNELLLWEIAWGGDREKRVFPETLLSNQRIEFWYMQSAETIEAGFICFYTNRTIGISNWFSSKDQSIAEMGIIAIVSKNFSGLPIVFWSQDNSKIYGMNAIVPIAPLQVWISRI